ncbi:MAG: hypothetical protein ABEJ28_02940 [Salinigranum sp.]
MLAPPLALGLAAVHLFSGRLRFLDAVPRSRWLSAAGGVSVGYVFVHVLPEIQSAGRAIERSGTALTFFEYHVYMIALLGFGAFYGLEQFVRNEDVDSADGRSRESGGADGATPPSSGVFWIHVGSFGAYNALVGYLLLHREQTGVVSLLLFTLAMGLHFLVNDYGLREYHGRTYRKWGRWVLAGAVFVGLGVGYLTEVGELVVSVLFAFLAGGVILNVIKEELPQERRSRFTAFALGATAYTILLLLV